jgi:putative flavoprotein involved in K+ transport
VTATAECPRRGPDVDAVVRATGYRPDHTRLDVPDAMVDGQVVQHRGMSVAPGLYFLGLPRQHSRGSALLGFVQRDAAWLADRPGTDRSARPTVVAPIRTG